MPARLARTHALSTLRRQNGPAKPITARQSFGTGEEVGKSVGGVKRERETEDRETPSEAAMGHIRRVQADRSGHIPERRLGPIASSTVQRDVTDPRSVRVADPLRANR